MDVLRRIMNCTMSLLLSATIITRKCLCQYFHGINIAAGFDTMYSTSVTGNVYIQKTALPPGATEPD